MKTFAKNLLARVRKPNEGLKKEDDNDGDIPQKMKAKPFEFSELNTSRSPNSNDSNSTSPVADRLTDSPPAPKAQPPKKAPPSQLDGYFASIQATSTPPFEPSSDVIPQKSTRGDLADLAKGAGATLLTSVGAGGAAVVLGFSLPFIAIAAGAGGAAVVGGIGVKKAVKFVKQYQKKSQEDKECKSEMEKQRAVLAMADEDVDQVIKKVTELFIKNKEEAKALIIQYVKVYEDDEQTASEKIGKLICGIIDACDSSYTAMAGDNQPIAGILDANGCRSVEGVTAFLYPDSPEQQEVLNRIAKYHGLHHQEVHSSIADLCAQDNSAAAFYRKLLLSSDDHDLLLGDQDQHEE